MALLTLKFVTDVRDSDYEVVEFHGELDQSNLGDTERQIADLLGHFDREYLILDLAYLRFLNSEGIGFIVATHMKLTKKKQKLLICNAKQNVMDIFQLIGLPKLIPVLPNMAETISFIKKNNI